MNTFFGQTFVCLIVMLKNKTRAIEDINDMVAKSIGDDTNYKQLLILPFDN